MITTTYGELLNAEPALARLLKIALPISIALPASRLYRLIIAEVKDFEQQRVELIKRLGVETEDKGFTVPPERVTEFMREVNSALAQSVTLNAVPLSTTKLLSSTIAHNDNGTTTYHPITLPGEDLYLLGSLLEDDAPEDGGPDGNTPT